MRDFLSCFKGWPSVFLFISLLLFGVVIAGFCASESEATIQAEPYAPRFEVRRWVNEARLPYPPPPLTTERFNKLARESKKRPITEPSDIVSAEVPKKLAKARKAIQACGAIQKAWKWEAVKSVVDSFGKTTPIFYMKQETYLGYRGNFGMAYNSEEDRLLVPYNVVDKTDEDLASILVHEATHAVVEQESYRISGYRREELAGIRQKCWDIDYEDRYASEGLAHYNQARWLAQCARSDAGIGNYFVSIWIAAGEGDYSAQGNFSQYLQQYVDSILDYHKPKPDEVCGPLIMIRGEKAGQYFFPADLYLDFIGPLIGAREKFQHP